MNILNIYWLRKTKRSFRKSNKILLDKIKNNADKCNTIEFIAVHFSKCFIDDLYALKKMSNFSDCYHYILLRTTIEQVIIFSYLIDNPDKVSSYLGGDIDENMKISETETDYIGIIKMVTEKRWTKQRIKDMSKIIDGNIEGNERSDGNLKIYEIYKFTSDYVHEPYFLKFHEEIEREESRTLKKDNKWMLAYVYAYFFEQYNKVIEF